MKSTAEILREARALIDTPDKWTRGRLFDCATGQHCALGAVAHVVLGEGFVERLDGDYDEIAQHPAVAALAEGMKPDYSYSWGVDPDDTPAQIVYMTNDRRRSHSVVLAGFDRAITLAETQA